MLLRRVRTTLAAVRHFSADAVAKQEKLNGALSTVKSTGGRDTLGRRLMGLVYAKRSAVITIRKWKEEGHTVQKYEINRIVRELRKLKRFKHALEVCEWMNVQGDIKLLPGDHAVHLDLIAKVRGLNSAEKFFEDLPEQMRGEHTCNTLLHTYVQNKMHSQAEALMQKMSECGFLKSPLPYNHMLSLYISNGQLDKVPDMIQELKKNTSPDLVTYNLLLRVCALQSDVETAEKIFLELQKAKKDPDWLTFSTLTSLYIKQSMTEKAASTLIEMEKRTSKKVRVAYSSLISLHTSMGNRDEVKRIWKKMKALFGKLNDAEYTCMISSLLKLNKFEEAENLYTEWESVSGTRDCRVPNLLLAAHINKNEMDMAEKFHRRMTEKGIVPSYTTWELLTWGYLKQNEMGKVLECLNKAVGSVKKWDPDRKLVREVFKDLEVKGDVDGAEQLLVTLREAGYVNTEVYNMLWRTYAKAGKMPLIVTERMEKDGVQLDDETRELIKLTSKMCVGEVVPSCLS